MKHLPMKRYFIHSSTLLLLLWCGAIILLFNVQSIYSQTNDPFETKNNTNIDDFVSNSTIQPNVFHTNQTSSIFLSSTESTTAIDESESVTTTTTEANVETENDNYDDDEISGDGGENEQITTTIKPIDDKTLEESDDSITNTTTTQSTPTEEEEDEEEEDETENDEGETDYEGEKLEEDNSNSIKENGKEGNPDDEEDEEYEEQCTFNQFMAGLNISHYLPEDRESLRHELNSFTNHSEHLRYSPSVNHTMTRLKRLLNLANGITSRQDFRSGMAGFIQQNLGVFLDLELDPQCMTSIISTIAAIRRSEIWAISVIDSMAKPPSGILSGISSLFGDFEQCLAVKSPETATEDFAGQYCLLQPIIPLPDVRHMSFKKHDNQIGESKILHYLSALNLDRYARINAVYKYIEFMKLNQGRLLDIAICLPNTCSPKQVESSINKLLYPLIGIPLEIQNSSCWTMAKTKDITLYFDRRALIAVTILSILSVMVILSTIHQQYSHKITKKTIFTKLIKSRAINCLSYIFSAASNTKRLVVDQFEARIAPIDTIRFFIVVLMGLTNTFINTSYSTALKKRRYSAPFEMLYDSKYFLLRAPILLNDALLVICGALFVRSIFRHLNSGHDKFHNILFLLRRWLRLAVPLFGSILFLFILPLTGYGPIWQRMIDSLLPACQQTTSLTSSLLFYSNWNFPNSNFSNTDSFVVCNPDTWFLSIIFQLNIIFFVLVVLVYQSPRTGIRILFLLTVSSIILNMLPKLMHSNTRTYYELTKQPSLWHLRRNIYLYYQNIVQYIGSFSMGTLLGYAIAVYESKKCSNSDESNTKADWYNWFSLAIIIAIYAWVNQFFILNDSPSESSVLMFFSFGRLVFNFAFAWIIYSFATNKSVTFARFLSVPWIRPFARLSFNIFLVQNLVQHHRIYSVKDTYVMTFKGTIENYIIDLFISTLIGYVLYLLFDGPMQRLNELWSGKETITSGHVINNKTYMFDESRKQTKVIDERSSTCPMEQKISTNVNNDSVNDDFAENGIITIRF